MFITSITTIFFSQSQIPLYNSVSPRQSSSVKSIIAFSLRNNDRFPGTGKVLLLQDTIEDVNGKLHIPCSLLVQWSTHMLLHFHEGNLSLSFVSNYSVTSKCSNET